MLAVAAAACELLSESRTSDNHISSQYSSAQHHQSMINDTVQETTAVMATLVEHKAMILLLTLLDPARK